MKKLSKVLLILGIIFLVIGALWMTISFIPPQKATEHNPWRSDKTLISAHRGGANLNPENTKMAFDYVINDTKYTDIVEIDVRLAKSDDKDKEYELVIIHDASINRTGIDENIKEEEKLVKDLTVSELKTYNLGINFKKDDAYPYKDTTNLSEDDRDDLTIMTLEEFFNEYRNDREFRLLLEIKDSKEDGITAVDIAEGLLANTDNSWWDERTMIISFSTDVVNHVLEKYPDRYVAGMGYNMVPFLVGSILRVDALFNIKYQSIQTSMITKAGPISINCATQTFVDSAHKRNQCVAYWTINEKEDMEYLISLGADVITTNSPDLLAEVLGRLEE